MKILMTLTYKPSWDSAPEWAQFLAKDDYGRWHWYEYEPNYRFKVWWISREGRFQLAQEDNILPKDTLETRPL